MINSLAVFSLITVIFGATKYFTWRQSNVQTVVTFIYILMVVGLQFYVNFNYIKQKCGGKGDYGMAFFNTVTPFILIFMVIFMILRTFPYWKSPFSNTFGYLLVRLLGIKNLLLEQLLKPNTGDSKQLSMIYEDPSLLINALTPQNVADFTTNSKGLFRGGAEAHFQKLYDFVVLKDVVAEYIWYYLTGILITAYSVSNITSLQCNVSANDMIKMHRLHVDNHKKQVSDNDPTNKKIYNITE